MKPPASFLTSYGSMARLLFPILIFVAAPMFLNAQTVRIRPADPIEFPALVDSNSPGYWSDGQRYIYNSYQLPIRSEAGQAGSFSRARVVQVRNAPERYRWIESAWADADGRIFAWYHREPEDLCPGTRLTAPVIGAMVSDDGVYFTDLGIVLKAPGELNCSAQNNYFAGGNGDFTVILDRQGEFFYFLFTNYGGPVEQQGIAIARMAFADRFEPAGHVWKFAAGAWEEPGLGGQVDPVFRAAASWAGDAPDSFWGPSVHWNTALEQYVVLMNHAIDRDWNQGGIHISFTADLANPNSWTVPRQLIWLPGWYPQVFGDGPGETDSIAGATARLFVMGQSGWEIEFSRGPLQITVEGDAPESPFARAPTVRTAREKRSVAAPASLRRMQRR